MKKFYSNPQPFLKDNRRLMKHKNKFSKRHPSFQKMEKLPLTLLVKKTQKNNLMHPNPLLEAY